MNGTWDLPSDTPARRRGFPLWAKVLLGGVLAVGSLVALMGTRALTTRTKVWPILRATTARLATDEGLRDLYAKNPDLAEAYPSAEAFREAVRAYLPAFGSLPEQEPHPSHEVYRVDADPFEFKVEVRGSGGGWLFLMVEGPSSFEQCTVPNEGIRRLYLAATQEGLEEARERGRHVRLQRDWTQFRETARTLATDEGARRLYQNNPGLKETTPTEAAFLAKAQTLRPTLASLPESYDEVRKDLRIHRIHGPFSRRTEMAYKTRTGTLRFTHTDQGITVLELRPPNP